MTLLAISRREGQEGVGRERERPKLRCVHVHMCVEDGRHLSCAFY